MIDELECTRISLFAREIMGISTDEEYVNWAISELMYNNGTESIKIIAGLEKPLNHFELIELVKKAKRELNIQFNLSNVIQDYALVLARQKLANKISGKDIANEMNKILIYTDYDIKYLSWFDIDEFFDDYYVISNEKIEDVIDRECKKMLEENGEDYFPELH